MHRDRLITDQGTDIEVRTAGQDKIGWVYSARWYEPDVRAGRRHRFVVQANAGATELASPAFD